MITSNTNFRIHAFDVALPLSSSKRERKKVSENRNERERGSMWGARERGNRGVDKTGGTQPVGRNPKKKEIV